MGNKLIIVFFMFFFLTGKAQEQYHLKKGGVTDGLIIDDSLQETYAVYLPENYSVENPPGIILLLIEEANKARESVQYFREIAEEQHYVVAASNTPLLSQDLKTNVLQSIRFAKSILSILKVDTEQIYISGKGKGAMTAIFFTQLNMPVAGVLPINSAWISSDYKLDEDFIGFSTVVGSRDYERELVGDVVRYFEDKNKTASVGYYEGGPNEWPDVTTLYNAISTLTMAATKANKRVVDTSLITTFFQKDSLAIQQLERKEAYYVAWQQLQTIEKKYEDFDRFKDQLKSIKKRLRKNKEFRKQRRTYTIIKEQEESKKNIYLNYLEIDVFQANFENIAWWSSQVSALEKERDSTNQLQANKAYRLLDYLDNLTKAKFIDSQNSILKIDNKIFISIIRTIVKPEEEDAYFEIIKLAGHDGDYQTALLYMEDLLQTGFSDFEELYQLEGILNLQISTDFNKLIKKYGGKPKYTIFENAENASISD